MVRALGSILAFKSQSILRLTSNIAVKIVKILPSSILLQIRVLDLICPLVDLLSSQQLQVAILSATAMNIILSKLSSRREREVWQILEETKAVGYLVHNIKHISIVDKPMYFQEMASVLSKILWRWPSFRFCVWNDSNFLNCLKAVNLFSESSVKVVVLQLYSSLGIYTLCYEFPTIAANLYCNFCCGIANLSNFVLASSMWQWGACASRKWRGASTDDVGLHGQFNSFSPPGGI